MKMKSISFPQRRHHSLVFKRLPQGAARELSEKNGFMITSLHIFSDIRIQKYREFSFNFKQLKAFE